MTNRIAAFLAATLMAASCGAQQPSAKPPVGTPPPAAATPVVEFAFEARVTLKPAVVLGETGVGLRQYIPITGGIVSGPKFKGEVIPGGWDYQLANTGRCRSLTADYFLKAEDGTVIHVLNQGLDCPGDPPAQAGRSYTRPQFEAPKGKYEWMTRATFVATLELDPSPVAAGAPSTLDAIRLRFYQVK